MSNKQAVKTIMADPLSLLREYNINKKDITERDNQIVFGEVSWPKDVKTDYVSSRKGENKEFYTLECLVFFLKNKQLIHPDYCKQAAEANIPAVFRPDRKNLLAFLDGETESINNRFGPKGPTQTKRTHNSDDEDLAPKKACIKKNKEAKVNKPAARRKNK